MSKGPGNWTRHQSARHHRIREQRGAGQAPLPSWFRHRQGKHHWQPSGGFLFFRFALAFGAFVLLGCGAVALVAGAVFVVLRRPLPFDPRHVGVAVIGVVFLLAMALRRVGHLASRQITSPLSDTMLAADALANGDLSARVPVSGTGEFSRFARSFNAMADALETGDRQRRELLADIAHELRTPLTVIQGNLEGLRDGVYKATPEHIALVLDETYKLSRLVDDLRLLTLADAGQLGLDLQTLDVRQVLNDVRDVFAHRAAEAGIHLYLEVTEPLPPLNADPQRLGQVLANLLSNALQHTPPGGSVTLGAGLTVEGDGLRLWVSDTGEGIPPEDLPHIFDRFWRGDPARSHGAESRTGLGLTIVMSLIKALGGTVTVESQPGEGTLISCILPLSGDGVDR